MTKPTILYDVKSGTCWFPTNIENYVGPLLIETSTGTCRVDF